VCGNIDEAAKSVVVFAQPANAAATLEALRAAREVVPGWLWILVTSAKVQCTDNAVSVLSGAPPAAATTYVTDGEGKVVLETFGLPPLHALQ
jgi:hypothetical protein